jgi:GNAT superfamily N-acetyltransferase
MLALLLPGAEAALTTEFLSRSRYAQYAAWLKAQDIESLHTYFGHSVTHEVIDRLVQKFSANSRSNHILVAKVDGQWAGTIHIAAHGKEVEFGVMVSLQYRKKGIATVMMEEAIVWARNRSYTDLFMHCITWNQPIKNLCQKHGLRPRNMLGNSEAKLQLKPPTIITFLKERMINAQRNWYGAIDAGRS